jgi:xylulokinase
MQKKILVGIDLGTSTLKAVFLDASLAKIVTTQVEEISPVQADNPEYIEYDPMDWWNGTIRLLKRGFENGVNPQEIAGICFGGWTVTALLVDKDGVPVTRAIHYNDMRHLSATQVLEELIGKECVEKNGNYMGIYNGFGKQYWWKMQRPDVFARAEHVMTEASWMTYKLTGVWGWNRPEAGFYAPYNAKTRDWDDEMLQKVDFPRSMFPRLYDSWEIVGRVTEEAARLTGLAAGIPVVAGVDDAAPVALTTGVITAGQCYISVGSGANIAANTDGPVSHPTIMTYPHCIPGLTMAITVLSSTGLSYKWMRNNLCQAESVVAAITGEDPYNYMSKAAEKARPGAGGVIFLPYLDGDYTPNNDPIARACFVGAGTATTKGDLLRATLEGVAFSILDNINLIRELGGNLDEIVLAGGIAKSKLWLQIIADVTGCVISLPEETEGAAFGSALVAGIGTGIYENAETAIQQTVKIRRGVFKPDPKNHELYKEMYEIYKGLYPALKPTFARLGELREKCLTI